MVVIDKLARFNPFHAHDYKFEVLPSKVADDGDWEHATADQLFPIEYRCGCGDTAVDGYDAIQRMTDSRLRRDGAVLVLGLLLGLLAVGLWAHRALVGW